MTDVAIDTLRIRGPGARRLAAVAARALPAALERALADVADITVDTVEVTLALDPDGYDDETLAILWADAIRAGVLAAGRDARPSVQRRPSTADPGRSSMTCSPSRVTYSTRNKESSIPTSLFEMRIKLEPYLSR